MKLNFGRWVWLLSLSGLLLGLACNLPLAIVATSTVQPEGKLEGSDSLTPARGTGAYPGPGSGASQPAVVSETPVVATPKVSVAYPGVGTPVEIATASTTATLAGTQLAGGAYPGPGTQNPASTPAGQAALPTVPLTSVAGEAKPSTPLPTATLLPTSLPQFTVTPNLTPTPTLTATRTPVAPPPWVSSQLQATEPLSVQLASGKIQLVEFFAFWDGTSLAMAPIVHGLEASYGDQVAFIYLDVDDPRTLVFRQALNYRMTPHYFLLDGAGQVLWQAMGYVSADQVIEQIDAALHR